MTYTLFKRSRGSRERWQQPGYTERTHAQHWQSGIWPEHTKLSMGLECQIHRVNNSTWTKWIFERWKWNRLPLKSGNTTDISMERQSDQVFAAEIRLHRITYSLLLQRENAGGTNGVELQQFKSCSFFHRVLSKCSIRNFPRWKVFPPGSQNQWPSHLLFLKTSEALPCPGISPFHTTNESLHL